MAQRLKIALDAEVVQNKDTRDKLRKTRKKGSQSEHIVFVRSLPKDRITVRQCTEHRAVITGETLTMYCESILGTKREWVFLLDKFFKMGVITVNLTERWFNLMMINLSPGPVEVQAKKLLLNRRHIIEFTHYQFEEVITWNREES